MMLQIGVGYAPRTLRALQTQPAQGLMLVVASDDAPLEVSATLMMIEVAAPSAHAGTYPLSLADLVRGPVCLVPPMIRDAKGTLSVEPGLWAYDAARGATTITRQWLANGAVVKDATSLSFAPTTAAVDQTIVLAETVLQNGIETGSLSAPFTLPGVAAPEPASLNVNSDATLELVTGTAGTTTVKVIEPAAYAGSHEIRSSELAAGPVWLVSPATSIATDALPRAIVTATPGLSLHDTAAGTMVVTGNWYRNEDPIAGATGLTYVIAEADRGQSLSYRQTAADRNGTRKASSKPLPVLLTGILADTFVAPNGTLLTAYVGESGKAYNKLGATAANTAITITDGYPIGGWWNFARRSDDVSSGKYAVSAKIRSAVAATAYRNDRGTYPAVGITGPEAGFYFRNDSGSARQIIKQVGTTRTVVKTVSAATPPETDYDVRLVVNGSTCTVYVNGAVVPGLGFTDPALVGGAAGLVACATAAGHDKLKTLKVETL